MARKITLTFLDEKVARTSGWPLRYAARQLGIWPDKTNHELYRYFVHWLDQSKYRLSTVWRNGRKLWRIFLVGYTPNEQITTAVNKLAGDGNDDVVIDYRRVLDRVQFRFKGQTDDDFRRTFYHNMSSSLLPESGDHNYWTKFLTDDIDGIATHPPTIPSAHGKVFKAGFDADTEI